MDRPHQEVPSQGHSSINTSQRFLNLCTESLDQSDFDKLRSTALLEEVNRRGLLSSPTMRTAMIQVLLEDNAKLDSQTDIPPPVPPRPPSLVGSLTAVTLRKPQEHHHHMRPRSANDALTNLSIMDRGTHDYLTMLPLHSAACRVSSQQHFLGASVERRQNQTQKSWKENK